MPIDQPLPLLGGLSPRQFMRRHWQKRPLLVRQALPGVAPPLDRAALFALAADDAVESRLVTGFDGRWRLRHGPFTRRQLPPVSRPGWTLLVQGLDLRVEAAHQMLAPFRFMPHACLDDLMVSWASDGGGVGPHLDAYDVFLIQVHGRRRWRYGPVADRTLVPGLPVRILQHFEPEHDAVLEPGDMLYLPPMWGHDGTADGECMTCSVGFRAPKARPLARDLLQGLADDLSEAMTEADGAEGLRAAEGPFYRDRAQPATDAPGQLPDSLRRFARRHLEQVLADRTAFDRCLGIWATEPKPQVWFEPPAADSGRAGDGAAQRVRGQGVRLDRRSRMAYDDHHVFLNGEAFVAAGRDARLMRELADRRVLSAPACRQLSPGALACVADWWAAGWLQVASGASAGEG